MEFCPVLPLPLKDARLWNFYCPVVLLLHLHLQRFRLQIARQSATKRLKEMITRRQEGDTCLQEKKRKKKKDKKEKKEACRTPDAGGASSDTSTPPRGNLTKEPLPSLPGSRQAGGDRRREGEGSRGGYLDGRRGREDSQERKWRGLGPGRGLRERNDPRERDREEGYRGHPGREDRRREDRRSREDKSNGERREDSRTHRR
jgi:hypothetical protein